MELALWRSSPERVKEFLEKGAPKELAEQWLKEVQEQAHALCHAFPELPPGEGEGEELPSLPSTDLLEHYALTTRKDLLAYVRAVPEARTPDTALLYLRALYEPREQAKIAQMTVQRVRKLFETCSDTHQFIRNLSELRKSS
jgi:hypothetical protein